MNGELRPSHSCHQAHMCRNNLPAFGQPDPTLRLPADTLRPDAAKLDVRGREAVAESRDLRTQHFARKPGRRPRRSKRPDFVDAVEVLAAPIPNRVRAVPEQLVEHGDVVADQRAFITSECSGHFGEYVFAVDVHVRVQAIEAIGATATPAASSW